MADITTLYRPVMKQPTCREKRQEVVKDLEAAYEFLHDSITHRKSKIRASRDGTE
jgi:hypothetical protein